MAKKEVVANNQVGEIFDWSNKAKRSRNLDVNELLYVLRANIMIFFSWGTSRYGVDNPNDVRMFRMQVNGHIHKGFVYVFLNGMDLFDVYLTDFNNKIVKIGSDLYNDQIRDWIDVNVEKQANYQY